MGFEFVEEPKGKEVVRIKVIGVGGAGGNAVNNMISSNMEGVELYVANTDLQDLNRSKCLNKVQLGPQTTGGKGCGGEPALGQKAAEESVNEIKSALQGANMVFIAAGMGGGTGTGAAPIIASICKELNILSVAVVSKPFPFEGQSRMKKAMEGVECLKKVVDSIIVIPNEKLLGIGGKSTKFRDLFLKADEVLFHAVKGISDLITREGYVNLDFNDLKRVLSFPGKAIMGLGRASGENKVMEATRKAISSPLLEDSDIKGARGLIMNFTGTADLSAEEIREASEFLQKLVSPEAETFWGLVFDDNMGDEVEVTVVATGINGQVEQVQKGMGGNQGKIVKLRDATPEEAHAEWDVRGPGLERLEKHVIHSNSMQRQELKEKEKKKGSIFKDLFGVRDRLDYPTFLRVKELPEKA